MAAPPCDCGKPSVMQTVSKQTANQGRKFFCCGQKASERCEAFSWVPTGMGTCANPLTAAGDGPVDLTGDDRPLSNPNGAGPSGVNRGGAARAAAAAAARRRRRARARRGARARARAQGGGARAAGAPGRKKKRCSEGANCPYKHEGQHMSEYYHDDDEVAQPAGGGVVPFSGSGTTLGGGGGGGGAGGLALRRRRRRRRDGAGRRSAPRRRDGARPRRFRRDR